MNRDLDRSEDRGSAREKGESYCWCRAVGSHDPMVGTIIINLYLNAQMVTRRAVKPGAGAGILRRTAGGSIPPKRSNLSLNAHKIRDNNYGFC